MSGKADNQRPAADEQPCPSAKTPAGDQADAPQPSACTRFVVERTFLGQQIIAEIFLPGGGILAAVYGGERPHIGAVSIAASSGEVQTTQFPTHKDAAVSERWAKELLRFGSPAVVTAGIHYDNLSKENIKRTIEVTEDMLAEALQRLSQVIS